MHGWKLVDATTGAEIMPGTQMKSGKGDWWTFAEISERPHAGSSGRIKVTQQCSTYDPEAGDCAHYWHDGGMDRMWYYPSVFGARIV